MNRVDPFRELDVLKVQIVELKRAIRAAQFIDAEAVATSMAVNAMNAEFFAVAHAAYRIKVTLKFDPEASKSLDDLVVRITEAVYTTIAF